MLQSGWPLVSRRSVSPVICAFEPLSLRCSDNRGDVWVMSDSHIFELNYDGSANAAAISVQTGLRRTFTASLSSKFLCHALA